MKYWWLFVLVLISVTGCGPKPETTGKISVVVSVPVQQEFVEQVGGDRVTVTSLLQPGDFPGSYELTAATLKKLSHSQVYFMMGYLPFEIQFGPKISRLFTTLQSVNLSLDLALIGAQHYHGQSSEPIHSADPHVWLSPKLVIQQIVKIKQILSELDPNSSDYFAKNSDRYIAALAQLDRDIRMIVDRQSHPIPVVVYHSFLGYFAREYGINQIVLEQNGKDPTAQRLGEIFKLQKTFGFTDVVVQRGHSNQLASSLTTQWSGTIVEVDPLGPDYLENMRQIAETISNTVSSR